MDRKIIEPLTVLYATQELTIPEVGAYGEMYGAQFMQELGSFGLEACGPWVFVSYKLPQNGTDRYRADFCLPVAPSEAYTGGRFSIKTLGLFPCVSHEYKGRVRHLFTQGYQPLVQKARAAQLRFTGESREVYHAWFGPNSPDNRIEIQFGVL